MSRRHSTILPLLAALLCWHSMAALAGADDAAVKGRTYVILASEQPGPTDPRLKKIPALSQPPFNAFKSKQIAKTARTELKPNKPVTVSLPNGRHLKLELVEKTSDGRYKVKVSINRPNQKDYLRLLEVIASPGEPFFVAGQKHQGKTMIIGVEVGEKPAKKTP